MSEKITTSKQLRRAGWLLFVFGFFYGILINTFNKLIGIFIDIDGKLIYESIKYKNIEFGVSAFLIISGVVLIGHEAISIFIQAWRKK